MKSSAPKRTTARRAEAHEPRLELLSPGDPAQAEGSTAEAVAREGQEPAYAAMSPTQREEARAALQQRLAAYLRKGRPRIVLTDNVHNMVTIKRGQGLFTFRLHHMFLDAPSVILRALAHYAARQDRDAAAALRSYIDANEHRIRRRDELRPIPVDVEGKHHNLQEIFDDLNARYFGERIEARITWGPRGRRKKGRGSVKLGSYTFEDELIRIHPVLDSADVPRFFVEWIAYHEMLHEVHDMPVVDGRRVYHTPEFRQAEANFERHAEAVLWERMHLQQLLDG
jgi:hypothetical protein